MVQKYSFFCLIFILPLMGCDALGMGDSEEKQGLGCFCTTDDDCARGTCQETTCSIGGIECVTDEDCACGECFESSSGVASCTRTCNTADDCYDREQCSVETIKKESDGLYYHLCVAPGNSIPSVGSISEGSSDSDSTFADFRKDCAWITPTGLIRTEIPALPMRVYRKKFV